MKPIDPPLAAVPSRSRFQTASLFIGLGLAGAMALAGPTVLGLEGPATVVAAVTVLCAFWWCTEALPIPVTSLVPFVVFPFAGVLNHDQLAGAFGDQFILLFMAGFMISRAAEKSKAHLRVAHGLMTVVGTSSHRRLVIAFLLTAAVCSMWVSNTATALILLPVAIAVLKEHDDARLSVSLLLAIAYGSSIGGVATLIGTPPNGIFVSTYAEITGRSIDFLSWMRIGVPISLVMLVAAAMVLTVGLGAGRPHAVEDLGAWTPAQRRVLMVLAGAALLWVTRRAPFGGWSALLDTPLARDATVGLAAVVLLFILPAGTRDARGRPERLLDWPTAVTIPWGILLLFAGGIAIAEAFQTTGLAARIGESLAVLRGVHPIVVIGAICLVVTFLTEVTSNTATATLLMPVLGAAAVGAGLDPAVFMIPGAISASCAFMLPVATPPNAIVFGSEAISIPQMARRGVWLNLIGVVVVALACWLLLDPQTGLGGTAR